MLFSSINFIGIFLPAVLIIYFIIQSREGRNWLLLLASLVFYAWGEPVWILALFVLSIVDYYLAILLAKTENPDRKKIIYHHDCQQRFTACRSEIP
jgi:alginate O-acetyltransferase complex protein AlgI